jgi:undecaprenyl pyrophosphate phosphatase UppP
MVAAALSGFLAIRFLLSYVKVRDYKPFVTYRFAFALLVWGLLLVRRAHLG